MFNFLKFLFFAIIGWAYATLSARRPGKEVRDDMKKAKDKGKSCLGVLFNEGKEMDMAFLKGLKKKCNKKDVQSMLDRGKKEIEKAIELAKKHGGKIKDSDFIDTVKTFSKTISDKVDKLKESKKNKK